MKTVAIIGGMGPQASSHAQKLVINELIKRDIKANTVHITLNIKPFFIKKAELRLTKEQKKLLRNTKADIGIVACNTAHVFFNDFQKLVNFPLVNIIDCEISDDSLIICSPTSKKLRLFGATKNYLNNRDSDEIGKIIFGINNNQEHKPLKEIVGSRKKLVFACSEISMLADIESLGGLDTLKVAIDKLINEL